MRTEMKWIAIATIVVAVVGIALGAQAAFASGNNGTCETMTREINTGTPENPTWVFIGFGCYGPCPGPPVCELIPQNLWTPIMQSGMQVGWETDCWCIDHGDPGNPYDDVISWDGPDVECDTRGQTNMAGSPTGVRCEKGQCPAPCLLGVDPNITRGTTEFPPGSGQWYTERNRECQWNGQ